MAADTLEAQLESVQAMIRKVESAGQEVGRGDRTAKLPAIEKLYERERKLKLQIARAAGRTGVSVVWPN